MAERKTPAQRRLLKEILALRSREHEGFVFKEDPSDTFHLEVTIMGPSGTPYEGGKFILDIHVTPKYPFEPPKCRFLTYIWHPNIYPKDGEICVDILKPENWSPAISLEALIMSIISLLNDPNPDSPLNGEAARMLMESPDQYDRRVRDEVRKHAM